MSVIVAKCSFECSFECFSRITAFFLHTTVSLLTFGRKDVPFHKKCPNIGIIFHVRMKMKSIKVLILSAQYYVSLQSNILYMTCIHVLSVGEHLCVQCLHYI